MELTKARLSFRKDIDHQRKPIMLQLSNQKIVAYNLAFQFVVKTI